MRIVSVRNVLLGMVLILAILLIIVLAFFRKTQVNPVTGKKQNISLTPEQEIALGIECAPGLAAAFGGLDHTKFAEDKLKTIGRKLALSFPVSKSPYQFDFHVLSDAQTIDAFALPGGQIFLTAGLLKKLRTDDAIAAVLSHEMGHVIGRHAAEKLFNNGFLQKRIKADHPGIETYSPDQIAEYLEDLMKLDYDKGEEIEADNLGRKCMRAAQFNPDGLREVKQILEKLPEDKRQFVVKHSGFAGK